MYFKYFRYFKNPTKLFTLRHSANRQPRAAATQEAAVKYIINNMGLEFFANAEARAAALDKESVNKY